MMARMRVLTHALGGKVRASLDRLLGARATLIQLAGMASIGAGLWLIFPPAALIIVGAGLLFTGQGYRARDE